MKHLRPACMCLILMSLITGFIYPVVVTLISQLAFPSQANGSWIISEDGKSIGSEWIGQSFSDPKYFWGRLSATGTFPYNAFNAEKGTASSGSNYGPLHPALIDAAKARVQALREADPQNSTPIPVSLITASGSGLDPYITPAAAEYQANRVARARGLDVEKVKKLIAKYTQKRTFEILGEERVHVLRLNLALNSLR